jgi:hypothetical protein
VHVSCDAGGAPSPLVAGNPYKGLEAFHEADAGHFFGREAVIEGLWQRCREFTRAPPGEAPLRFLPIIGPSGCGKSSLARAGLVPELGRRPLPGLEHPRIAVLVPGSHPIDSLAAVLARMITEDRAPAKQQSEIAELLLADSGGQQHALRRTVRFLTGGGRPLVLLVDQCEEVWSLCDAVEERAAFIAGLLDVAADRDSRVSLVLTLRSDFLSSVAAHPALSQAISRRAFLVPAMTEAELCRAIGEPARRAGLPLDDATIQLMVSQTEGREGALPLLQFALTRIFDGLKKGIPAAETLTQLGGVGGALAKEAERLYEGLHAADQRIVRRAFLAQVRLGEGTQDSRRRAAVEEIVAVGEQREHVLAVLRVFSQPGERLITLGGDPSRGAVTAELTHEALLEHWSNLRNWISESRDDLRFQRRLTEAAEDWNTQKRPAGLLWRSPGLDLLRAFHRRKAADMTGLQSDFLKASERQQRFERVVRYASFASALGIVAVIALSVLWQNYRNWEQTRPWAHLMHAATGQSFPLSQNNATIGRATPGVREINHQVSLPDQRISRIHMSVFNTGVVIDWRSLYGTTLNGDWLPYGEGRSLKPDDVVVLSGLHVFTYKPIEWRWWHYLRPPGLAAETPLPGWAVLVDGHRRSMLPLVADEQYVTLNEDGIMLSEQPSENAVLVVRRRVLVERAPLARRTIEGLKSERRADNTSNFDAWVVSSQATPCRTRQKETAILTLQALAPARERVAALIKEDDYDHRRIVLPDDAETAAIIRKGANLLYGTGDILFLSDSGPFQVVPTRTADVGQICAPSR